MYVYIYVFPLIRIDASAVRIMKTRKTLGNSLLVAEITNQLIPRFKPTVEMIKQRIEHLIGLDYLERDHNNRYFYFEIFNIYVFLKLFESLHLRLCSQAYNYLA